MAYTVQELITDSYYLANVYSQDLETVSGSDMAVGLRNLNAILSLKSVNASLNPYYKKYNFSLVTGQEKYSIDNLISIETFTFNIQNVRYASQEINRDSYFGDPRVNNVNSLSITWHSERRLGGMDLYVYFLPVDNYQAEIWGKFAISNVDYNDDLEVLMDQYFIAYLKYELANWNSQSKQLSLPADIMANLKDLRNQLTYVSPPDCTIQKRSAFKNGGITWGMINLGLWVP